jgi:arylsulfatase A-like enzyme
MLIVLDTVRADHMDLFGYERDTMPMLTNIARSDFHVAETIMAAAPSSLPSHGSMFTGLYASSHGGHYPFMDDPNPPPYSYFMRDDIPTLAEWLGQLGYHTVGISANFGVLSSYGLTRGLVDYDDRSGPKYQVTHLSWLVSFRFGPRSFASVVLGRLLPTTLSRHMSGFNPYEPPYRRARQINERISAWFGDYAGGPFFMFVNYFDAHLPYVPVPWLDQRFSPRPKGLSWIGFPDDHLPIAQGRRIIPQDELDYLRGQYDAELIYLDQNFARLVDFLKTRGLYDDTLMIVVSDHGESFYEHGFLNHGVTLYEPELSVPLLIKLPRNSQMLPPDNISHFQFVDIIPTIAAIVNIEPPASLQGSAWGSGRDYALAENYCLFRDVDPLRRELFGVRIADWKYIASTLGAEEAYDLSSDPEERTDVFGKYPELEERARRIHAEHISTYHERPAQREHGDSAIERLRALGYVD